MKALFGVLAAQIGTAEERNVVFRGKAFLLDGIIHGGLLYQMKGIKRHFTFCMYSL